MTTSARSVNRASRLQLKARFDLADRAVNLLHNKEEALRREQTRLEGHSTRTEQDWTERCREATAWLLRARALGASPEIAAKLGHTTEPATIAIAWQAAMGVTYPGAVTCTPGAASPASTSTAAIVPTADAFQRALTAGATHAAATAALQRLRTELSDTRKRRRAIEQRLQPQLKSQLHQLDLELDERDRDTAVRTQLAARQRSTSP
jgi:vacuolar-type H+-ATPase subunit D/Vma8